MSKSKNKQVQALGADEVALDDLFLNHVAWDTYDPAQRKVIEQLLLILVACEEDNKLNMTKIRKMLSAVSGGKFKFDG